MRKHHLCMYPMTFHEETPFHLEGGQPGRDHIALQLRSGTSQEWHPWLAGRATWWPAQGPGFESELAPRSGVTNSCGFIPGSRLSNSRPLFSPATQHRGRCRTDIMAKRHVCSIGGIRPHAFEVFLCPHIQHKVPVIPLIKKHPRRRGQILDHCI
jgi:hypothetical protein